MTEELPEEEKPVEKPVSNEAKLWQILWLRKPPLDEQEVNKIIAENKEKPLKEVLLNYPVIRTESDDIVAEFDYLSKQPITTEFQMRREINFYRATHGKTQFTDLPIITYDELVALGVVKPISSVGA